MTKLDKGEKSVVMVSQERIISNIVEQVENCGNHKNFQDIFVTAPTGAGKSVMFQVPAIYLAEKYNLLTIVISPLIGLMNDQVKNLELKNYTFAETINSDISPIIKQDIISKVSEGKSHILYISPETLLSRSDVEQLIGDRTIGMIVIDEAHIVTTWGKQFRPDYWYLGEHIRKLRKRQIDKKQRSFAIATFTATAIYHGLEDMYTETINSLYMLSPITYLGYIKRNDINIVIDRSRTPNELRTEYELDKMDDIANRVLPQSLITRKKTLVYFPTVAFINKCYEYLQNKNLVKSVTIYHGSLDKNEKQENYEDFYTGKKNLMLATKAFGMGIDINNIERVVHVAPTGNVCDYVQEIGRAARKESLTGEAYYHYNSRDFKFINKLHGMSTIHNYQLIKVIKKIGELYQQNIDSRRELLTKKRNSMLLDSENFSYIFNSPMCDETESINKVKTALLLIQKDFESKFSFSPIAVRPIPLFAIGFFEVDPIVQNRISRKYRDVIEEIEPTRHICRIKLDTIWKNEYTELSFPKFKYMLYSRNEDLSFVSKYPMIAALCVSIKFADNFRSIYENVIKVLRSIINNNIASCSFISFSEMVSKLKQQCNFSSEYKAQTICEVIMASIDSYKKEFTRTHTSVVKEKTRIDATRSYQFNPAINCYFEWLEKGVNRIVKETQKGKLYLVNDTGNTIKEYSIILGILESLDSLTFEMLGGANSQLYIYIQQMLPLKNIISAPYKHKIPNELH
jgi:ATP-dependent DNA helicase RecQ